MKTSRPQQAYDPRLVCLINRDHAIGVNICAAMKFQTAVRILLRALERVNGRWKANGRGLSWRIGVQFSVVLHSISVLRSPCCWESFSITGD